MRFPEDNYLFLFITLITFLVPLYALIKHLLLMLQYKKVDNKDNLSGCEIASKVLENTNNNTYIIESNGIISDYYDVNRDVIKLNRNNFHNSSIFTTCISAKIATDKLLYKDSNIFYKMKVFLNPLVKILTLFAYVFFIVSILSKSSSYIRTSILVLFVIVIYYILTLPIENKVIKKAKLEIKKNKLIKKSEIEDIDKVFDNLIYVELASIYYILIYNFKRIFK